MRLLDTIMAPFTDRTPWVRADSSGITHPRQWLIDWITGGESDAGVTVNAEKSLTYATIWQACSVICGDVGQLPMNVYRRTGEDDLDKEIDRKHPAFRLVRHRPNPVMSWQDFSETMQLYALLWGNGVAEIKRDNRGRPVQLTPLLPDRTWLEIVDGKPWIVTRQGENREDLGSYRKIPCEDVLHLRGLSWTGLWGINVVSKARNSFGLALGQEKYANKFFGNHQMPAGVLEHPGKFQDDKAIERLRKDWEKIHQGLDNVGRVAILEQGMKFNAASFNNRDSQWLEGRKFQRGEIASWFNLPPHKVGDLEKATFTNIEEQNRSYLQTSLMRWLVKWCEECREKLLTEREKETDSHFFEYNVAALLRGDIKSRYEAYQTGLGGAPFLTQNEVRRFESLPGVEGGDEIRQPLNMDDPGGEDNEEKDAVDPSMQNSVKEAFRKQLAYFGDVEVKRIRAEAKDPKKFTDWMDRFYSDGGWASRLREHLTPWGFAEMADVWCDDSAKILELVVSTASAAELAGAVDEALAGWPARVDAMVRVCFEGQTDTADAA
jgi:HK97 family phage portal protein